MVASMTVESVVAQAGSVVGSFGDLILLVTGLGIGVWAVRFVIAQVRRAR